uniref:Uncharacterized protein n=1 Tax=Muribaculaceae bacterium Z82 TaxID=2304548 RepID=A0A7C9JEB2_9BACT
MTGASSASPAIAATHVRALRLARMLWEETDAERGLTMAQIIARLGEYGISAERKSIYKAMRALRSVGLDARMLDGTSPAEYAIVSRPLDAADLADACAAVRECAFLDSARREELEAKIGSLAPAKAAAAEADVQGERAADPSS